jgi:glucose-1-phosphate cytidylyltransferase
MKVAILAGGMGSRLMEETTVKPKPMVMIGDRPILWHIMKIYAAAGFHEFVIALGYRGDVIKDYFINYQRRNHDLTVDLKTGEVTLMDGDGEDWIVHLLDTGLSTQTGGRIKRIANFIGREPFMLTYGDGVANIALPNLLDFHRSHTKLATVAAVRPPARFGGIDFDESGRVTHFVEKPQIGEGWINGGFFVVEPGVADYIEGDDTYWEHGPMGRLAAEGQLMAYRHEGFWQSMDTLRDVQLLENLWRQPNPPWKAWK